jgi:hypothetical protein
VCLFLFIAAGFSYGMLRPYNSGAFCISEAPYICTNSVFGWHIVHVVHVDGVTYL